ncbi:MAG: thioredoxin family protein [Phycisphaerae bacterium]|jgi:thiol-disulfide isomerase/thioredoxin|nr:thioredoxin family protein [Phycisphaerae bacterium]
MMSKVLRNCVVTAAVAVATFALIAPSARAADKPDPEPTTQPKPKAYPPYPKVIGLGIGDAAPDFKLPGVDGKTHTLAEYKDAKILAIVFTCNHCPTSRMYEDAIIKLSTDYAKKGVKLVAISPNDPGALRPDEVAGTVLGDSFEEMKIRAKEKKYPFPYLYDGDTQKAAMAYGATLTPQMFIFDAERKLRYTGAVEGPPYSTAGGPHARVAIEAMLAGKKIVYDRTRPFGCSTKWGFKRRSVDYDTAMWNEKPVTMADIDLAGFKKLAANDSNVLKLICIWSLDDKSSAAAMADLVMLRRIYQHRPLELITVNIDPAAKKKDALALLKKNHAAKPSPSRFAPIDPKTPINYMFTGKNAAELFKALKAKADSKPAAPYSAMIIPGGEVIHTQTKKLNPKGLRAKLVTVFRR